MMASAGGHLRVKDIRLPTKARLTSELVPDLSLTHGSSLWVLKEMGFSAGVTDITFNYYIKSLRKLGVPFAPNKPDTGKKRLIYYSFNHLMELSVVLSLRVYGIVPDAVLAGIIRYREELYPLYRRAYIEYSSGLGAPVHITAKERAAFDMNGVYLDLKIRFGGGRAFEFGPPRTISPFEALRIYARLETPGRAHLPLNLSALAVKLVECADAAPTIHRGPN
jgi:hypothetical protein